MNSLSSTARTAPVAFFFLMVLIASPALADKIVLKNGEVIRGKVIAEEDGRYVIRLASGKMKIAKDKVEKIIPEKGAGPDAPAEPATEPPPPPPPTTGDGGSAGATTAPPPDAVPAAAAPLSSTGRLVDLGSFPTAEQVIVPAEGASQADLARVDGLVKSLASEDPAVVEAAVQALAGLGPVAFTGLTSAVAGSKDKAVVARALAALAKAPDSRTFAAFRFRSTDDNLDVRKAVARALASFGDPGLAVLIEMLKDANAPLRAEVAGSIGAFPHGAATLAGLLRAVTDSDEGVRGAAEQALMAWDHDSLGSSEDLIVALLADKSAPVRRWAAKLCGSAGLAKSVKPLLGNALKDSDPSVRSRSIDALVLLRDPADKTTDKTYLAMLVQDIQDEDPAVRLSACQALCRHGEDGVVNSLIVALSDESPSVRTIAYDGLRTITGQNFAPISDEWTEWRSGEREGTNPAGE